MSFSKVPIPALKNASPAETSGDSSGSSGRYTKRVTRASKPKVKSGCLTCRIRKVKCDETKPKCYRCTSTGRQCDGYTQAAKTKQSPVSEAMAMLSLARTPSPRNGPPEDLRAEGFFYYHTAPQLSSGFDAEFWTQIVLQMSHAETAIRHAMITIATLSEQRENLNLPSNLQALIESSESGFPYTPSISLPTPVESIDSQEQQALTHYNKSISELARNDLPVHVALIACILFVCIEFLRGDADLALQHFASGMKIVSSIYRSSQSAQASRLPPYLERDVLGFMNRLELLSSLFGRNPEWEYVVDLADAVPDRLGSMRDARDSLVDLMNIGLRFIRTVQFQGSKIRLNARHLRTQTAVLRQLEQWLGKFHVLLGSAPDPPPDEKAVHVLRLHYLVASIWIRTVADSQMQLDRWVDVFEQGIRLGETIQELEEAGNTSESRHQSFLFDMEIVGPLWFLVRYCRHPVIRRRGIAVLKRSIRREGLWDAHTTAVAAERVVAIEEKGLAVLDGSEMPCEKDRIYETGLHSTSGAFPNKQIMTFHMRPEGPDGPWTIFHETVVLTSDLSMGLSATTSPYI